jgi:2-polyprenyl-3-methyl-5-hydroxy-6-metoxy-1,4-benzoquinol methylase
MTKENAITVSAHYAGNAGAQYVLGRQSDPHQLGYRINSAYFEPYLKSSDVILDFGCGNGGMLRVLREHVSRADGLEVNPHAAELAKEAQANIYTSLDELPDFQVYDAIVSNHVLEHVRDVPSTLERLRMTLKQSGLLLVKVPIDDWRAGHQRKWSGADRDHHLQTWTPRLMGNVLCEAGYVPLTIDIVVSAWHPKLFFLTRLGLAKVAFWGLAVLKRRRELFVVARPAN